MDLVVIVGWTQKSIKINLICQSRWGLKGIAFATKTLSKIHQFDNRNALKVMLKVITIKSITATIRPKSITQLINSRGKTNVEISIYR